MLLNRVMIKNKNREEIAKYIGENYGGPILVPYIKWILDRSVEKKISRLYFIARDGYILKRIADIFINSFKYSLQTYYIYGSRKTFRSGIFIQDEIDIIKLLDESYKERINSIKKLAKVFQIEEKELRRFLPKKYRDSKIDLMIDDVYVIQNYLEKCAKFKRFLKDKHTDFAERTIKYLRQEINTKDDEFAFVELYGSGYTQNGMSLLLNTFYDKPIKTFFYYQHRKQDGDNIFYSFAENEMNIKILIEILCRSLEGQTIDYYFSGKKWKPVTEQREEGLLANYSYNTYIKGVIHYTYKNIENNLKMVHVKKWDEFYNSMYHPMLDFIGDMPYGVTGMEKRITRFAPKLSMGDIFCIFANGLEYEEHNKYTGAMLTYSIRRFSGVKKKLFDVLLKNQYLISVQEKNIEKKINKRLKWIDYFEAFPIIKGKKIVVYGAGRIGKQMVKKILQDKKEKLVLWIDKNEELGNMIFPVNKPEVITTVKYDYVILASVCREQLDSMRRQLRELNIFENKIVY